MARMPLHAPSATELGRSMPATADTAEAGPHTDPLGATQGAWRPLQGRSRALAAALALLLGSLGSLPAAAQEATRAPFVCPLAPLPAGQESGGPVWRKGQPIPTLALPPAPAPMPAPMPAPVAAAPVAAAPGTAAQSVGSTVRQSGAATPAPAAYAGIPARPADTARYPGFTDQPWKRVSEAPTASFAAHTDTGSYANVRRFLNRGALPPPGAVRVEELLNYFSYDDPLPAAHAAQPFAVTTEWARAPWAEDHGLLRVAVRAKDLTPAEMAPAHLVLLVDVSGSMAPADRLPMITTALHLFVEKLRPQDRVSIVTYANGTQRLLGPTPGDERACIRSALDRLSAGGGTNGEGGLKLAYQTARENFVPGAINRVLLATDGDLNIGESNPERLLPMVEAERDRGIGLTTLGVGDSNYNEVLMKRLADAGDGSYHYLDTMQEALKVLVRQHRSTLAVVAKDLKIQLEFNPLHVAEYRLLGWELSGLTREQFADDRVDSGDIGAGHAVTALFEVVPRGAAPMLPPLRYGAEASTPEQPPAAAQRHAQELATVSLRWKTPATESRASVGPATPAQVHTLRVPAEALRPTAQASADFRFSAAVAGWGQWLRQGPVGRHGWGPKEAAALAATAIGPDPYAQRREFERLVELSQAVKPIGATGPR